jgi:hypothetical protein
MEKKIQELKERFINAKSESEIEAIDREMDALASAGQSEFEDAMLGAIRETNSKVEGAIIKKKLESVLPAISVSFISKKYFGKTPQWLYQRLNGNVVNGKESSFTESEINTLVKALTDISTKINQSVAFIV